ncbi:phosphoglycerate kinase [bacterium]|nr:phosphoglycerate kinase [bacterium]
MLKIEDVKIKDKRVLVRVDFNVPLDKEGKIADDFRIRKTLPTIRYLKKRKSKIILISHFGRPSGKEKKYSLKIVVPLLERLLKTRVNFFHDCIGRKVQKKVNSLKEGEILLLENLRFYKEETQNNLDFARQLALLGDLYVNDAFSVCHRLHASVVGIPKFLPAFPGFLLQEEIKNLSKIVHKPKRPLVIIIGGKKISKIKFLPKLLKISDFLLLNGFLSEVILIAKNILVERPYPDGKILDAIKEINLADPSLHLPKDVFLSLEDDWTYKRIAALGTIRKEERVYDIGVETIELYSEIIKKAKTIFWAGPLGMFEEERFERGTKEVGERIVRNYKAFKVAGGGDTISALKKFRWMNKFDYISTGGGAMLEFLCSEELPGIKALENSQAKV